MGFKKMDKSLNSADLFLANSLKHNRSIVLMENIDKAINWSKVESILMSHYSVGTSLEGADAYPPLLLFKCLLLFTGISIYRMVSTDFTMGLP